MSISKNNLITLLSCFLFVFSLPSFAEKHHAKSPSFNVSEVTENIMLLQGKGGNIALLKGKQGLLMIDADYKEMSDALIKQLKSFGGLTKLNYLINTHWHGDHTQGNYKLGPHALIVSHDNVRTRLLTSQEVKLFKMVTKPYPADALPNITYDAQMTIHFNNEEVVLQHYARGHTDGDSIVFFKQANVVHMGDHYFAGFFPFVDIQNGGNVLNMANNVNAVINKIDDKTKVIPGHGPLSNKAELIKYSSMLVGTSEEVSRMIKDGLTLEQIKSKGLSSKWKAWTNGFIKPEVWIGIVYQSLMNKN